MRVFNILYVTHERKLGGASKSLVALAQNMVQKGHHVYSIVPQKGSDIDIALQQVGVETICGFYGWWQYPAKARKMMILLYKLIYRFNFFSLFILKRKIKNLNIDVIHTNTSVLDIGAKMATALGIKHVWHFREFGDADLELKYIKGKDKSLAYVNTHSDCIVFISKSIQAYFKDSINQNKTCMIYNGIAKDYLLKKQEGDYDIKKVHLLISGALQPNKGQNIAIEAAYILKKRGYSGLEMVIAGRDINHYSKYLIEQIDQYEVGSLVTMVGFVADMKALRAKVEVELVCSNKEAFGRVSVEAMMSSNMVIASNSGANPELIKEHFNGLLFVNNNAEDLADKIQIILDDKKGISEMGMQAFTYAKDLFTAEKNANEIEKVYEEIV